MLSLFYQSRFVFTAFTVDTPFYPILSIQLQKELDFNPAACLNWLVQSRLFELIEEFCNQIVLIMELEFEVFVKFWVHLSSMDSVLQVKIFIHLLRINKFIYCFVLFIIIKFFFK